MVEHQLNGVRRHIIPGNIRLETYHGPNRENIAKLFSTCDILLTTYETLRLDWNIEGPLFSFEWFRVVLDEG